jgi:2',3'-cyclic-nucleotide 2'-phosphodiesterase (5'-nucleotidase family)
MTNRRKFLIKTGIAATGLMVAKSFEAVAKQSSSWSGMGFNYNSITFLHTSAAGEIVASQIKKVAAKNTNIVLLNAGYHSSETQQVNFDASMDSLNETFEGAYNIIYKDNIKIGVIAANDRENDLLSSINNLSAYLKKEKNCQLVICLSQMGYKQKNYLDDITLAEKSYNIDMILGKQAALTPARPVIAKNKNKAEVILQYTKDSEAVLGKIKIGFSPAGNKHHISF